MLHGTSLLPNQNHRLCSPPTLKRDSGVSEELKDICRDIGIDFRERLFLDTLNEFSAAGQLPFLSSAIAKAVPESVYEEQVIEDTIKYLQSRFPEDEDCRDELVNLQKASVRLLWYIWESLGTAGASIAKNVPLITSKQRSVKWSPDRNMMAPVCTWHQSAQPFANAYPPHRVLADLYAGLNGEDVPNVVSALIKWKIAIADPLAADEPAELKDRRVAAISSSDTTGVTVRGNEFSQIGLLHPEVLNRCQEGIEEARALLGLVLCHIAPHDLGWQVERVVKGRKSGEEVDVLLRGALWLADIRFRAWVPVRDEDGKFIKMTANLATLKDLLEPAWLVDNNAAIRLLSEYFGFDELDLRLLGIAPDATKRQELRNGLAKLVESAGPDLDIYAKLTDEIEAQRRRGREIDRCRRFGLAVQDAIKSAIEIYGKLKLELIDKGFDYEAVVRADSPLEDAASQYQVGPYLLEVKATTVGEVRLTPTQASVASEKPANYVLCVVDLRNLSDDEIDAEWTASRVEPLAKIVSDIGTKVSETCFLIDAARTSAVSIRNDSALRYGVPVIVWESGITIFEWIAEISERLAGETSVSGNAIGTE